MAKTKAEAIEQVRRLLKLGESANENEAASAVAMAARIMERYRIEAATLDEGDDDQAEPEECRDWEDPLGKAGAVWRAGLATALSIPNGCQVYRIGGALKIIGTASNVQTVRYLFAYCVAEVDRHARRRSGNGRTWLNNYRHGCVDAIRAAIQAERVAVREQMRAEAATAGALVKIDQALVRVDQERLDAVRFGRVKVGRRSAGRSSHRSDPGARATGRHDGKGIYPGGGSRGGQVGAGTRRLN